MKFENLGRKIDGFLGAWKQNWEDRNAMREFNKAMAQALKENSKLKWDAEKGFIVEK